MTSFTSAIIASSKKFIPGCRNRTSFSCRGERPTCRGLRGKFKSRGSVQSKPIGMWPYDSVPPEKNKNAKKEKVDGAWLDPSTPVNIPPRLRNPSSHFRTGAEGIKADEASKSLQRHFGNDLKCRSWLDLLNCPCTWIHNRTDYENRSPTILENRGSHPGSGQPVQRFHLRR